MAHVVRSSVRALSVLVVAVGLLVGSTTFASADEPAGSLADPSAPFGTKKFGYLPGLTEYRVHSTVVLDLGPGVQGGIERTPNFLCVNATGEFPFRTSSSVPEVHDLWMDASMSVPLCWQEKSYARFRVYVTSPYQENKDIILLEDQDGKPGRSPYLLRCDDGLTNTLKCTEHGDLSLTISCDPDYLGTQCPRRGPLPGTGSIEAG